MLLSLTGAVARIESEEKHARDYLRGLERSGLERFPLDPSSLG